MSNWKVSKTKIEIFTHPNAENLVLGRVESYQVVVQKGLYKDGDEVVFVPEKSILSGNLKTEYEKYLAGPNKDRVKSVRLRGEISCGIIIPQELLDDISMYEFGEDISEKLGIFHYEPPIPPQLSGKVKAYSMLHVGHHDCEHANVYANEFEQGERVVCTEKIHGSQFILAHDIDSNETIISSKGLLKNGFTIEEDDQNTYWAASKNESIVEKIRSMCKEGIVQVFGEVIPVQKGYTYGYVKPTVKIFDVRLNSESIPYDMVSDEFKSVWVPIIYDGPINLDEKEIILYENAELGIRKTRTDYIIPKSIIELSKGNEQVSGKELHIREGIVLAPYIDRRASDRTRLRLKIINPAYKEDGEEIA